MTIKTRKGFNIQPVLDLLSQSGNESDDPPRGFGLLFSREKAYLRTAIDAKGLSESQLTSVIDEALCEAPKLTQKSFLEHCNHSAGQIKKNKEHNFKVVFPLWGAQHLISGRRKWDKVWIAFDVDKTSAFARKALADRITQLRAWAHTLPTIIKQVEELPWAVCSIRSINMVDAFERAEYAISKELGLYSIVTSLHTERIFSSSEYPINTILFAPHMTVHNPSGSITSDIFWYNRWDRFMDPPTRTQDEITKSAVRSIGSDVRSAGFLGVTKRSKCSYVIITHSHISTWRNRFSTDGSCLNLSEETRGPKAIPWSSGLPFSLLTRLWAKKLACTSGTDEIWFLMGDQ